MHIARNVLALIALNALAGSSIGQETQPPPAAQPATPPAAQPAKPAAETPPAATPPASTAPGAGAQSAPAQKMPVVKDDEFIPTQEIQGDEEVTFPVDI